MDVVSLVLVDVAEVVLSVELFVEVASVVLVDVVDVVLVSVV